MAVLDGNADQPPPIRQDERPDDAEFARLALVLLQEMAQSDPHLAERMTTRGIDPVK